MQLTQTNNGQPWTRLDLEEILRKSFPDTDNSLARYAVTNLKLAEHYFNVTPYCILLHWCLDLIIVEAKKNKNIEIKSTASTGLVPPRKGDAIKIVGFDPNNIDAFMDHFYLKLAALIKSKNAMFPSDLEGIDTTKLRKLCNEEIIELPSKTTKKSGDDVLLKRIQKIENDIENILNRLSVIEEIISK